ncbi:MAG: hypothetical protein K9N35_04485 [Candidatus Marinimicrobia bacterium]|nr:hypothetical protein [Candidatus Neomarinimicrobiota bacterium]
MKKILAPLILIFAVSLHGQLMRPTQFSLSAADTVYEGLIGSSITDIDGSGNKVWLGSGHGLSASFDGGETFIGYSRQFSDLGRGGISALEVYGDTVWVAMGFDSTTALGDLKAGGGISRSVDGGQTWTFLGQPMDSLRVDTIIAGDTTFATYSEMDLWGVTIKTVDVVTPIQNITYDLAYDGTRLWATSFGGGLRVSSDLGDTWRRVMLPWDNFNSLDSLTIHSIKADILNDPEKYALDPVRYLNHLGFSVKAWNDTVWVGTSGGVNRSIDGGKSWQHFHFQNSNLSGNWVIALNRQLMENGKERMWASTVTTGEGDITGLSFFESEMDYWRAPLLGISKSWNISSNANSVYSATDEGLWKSKDGLHFTLLPNFHNADYSEVIYSDEVYSVFFNADGSLWVGTGDGLAISYNDGLTWNVFKARVADPDDTYYAYPNPFTPRYDKVVGGQGNLIIRFVANLGEEITITVFDFAMHTVKKVVQGGTAHLEGAQERTWNGRNEQGYLVANGTYFIRLEIGSEVQWTKVMVIN